MPRGDERGTRLSLNLASRPFLNDRPVILLCIFLFSAGAGALAADVNFFAKFFLGREELRSEIAKLESETVAHQRAAERDKNALAAIDTSALAQAAEFLNMQIGARALSWTRLLAELGRALPPEVRLTSVNPGFDGERRVLVKLDGIARNTEALHVFIDELQKPPFAYPRLAGERDQEKGSAEGRSFDMSVYYEPEHPREEHR